MGLMEEEFYIEQRRQLISHLRRHGFRDELVLNALSVVPRQIFVEPSLREYAYEDNPLPIKSKQTISQPYIVAAMTSALCAGVRLNKVLEVGTGSGYQAAILSQLVEKVYTIERIQLLSDQAKLCLEALGLTNVFCRCGDGYKGWVEFAPFDGIIVTAAADEVPQPLLEQLAPQGRLVIPVGSKDSQQLKVITRQGEQFNEEILEAVRFVPLLRGVE